MGQQVGRGSEATSARSTLPDSGAGAPPVVDGLLIEHLCRFLRPTQAATSKGDTTIIKCCPKFAKSRDASLRCDVLYNP